MRKCAICIDLDVVAICHITARPCEVDSSAVELGLFNNRLHSDVVGSTEIYLKIHHVRQCEQ